MRIVRTNLVLALFVSVLVLVLPPATHGQNREKFVISARAGGVNAVTGRATMLPHGNSEWQQLTIKEDLETGDVVRTGVDGRVEMLLNPGSYMRIGEQVEGLGEHRDRGVRGARVEGATAGLREQPA